MQEHFYILLPVLLVLTQKKWRAQLLLILAAAVSLHRIAHNSRLSFHTDMRLDELLVPAAMAILLCSPLSIQPRHYQRFTQILRLWPLIWLVLLIPITYDFIPRTTGFLIAWMMPLAIFGTMLRPQSWVSRSLENPVLRYIGRLSYSLYLWQQLFIISISEQTPPASASSKPGPTTGSWPLPAPSSAIPDRTAHDPPGPSSGTHRATKYHDSVITSVIAIHRR